MSQLFSLSLEEILNIRVSSTSLFDETLWESSASVAVIDQSRWQKLGAQKVSEAIGHQPGIAVETRSFAGGAGVAVRGYTGRSSIKGIAVLLDGIPMNTLKIGTGMEHFDQYQLGVLDRIETVRGPGSALYGANAFHGVVSMTSGTAAPNQLHFATEAGADGYSQGQLLAGHQLGNNIFGSVALSYANTPDQDKRYQYTNPSTNMQEYGERAEELESYSAIVKLQTVPQENTPLNINFYVLHQDSFQAVGEL